MTIICIIKHYSLATSKSFIKANSQTEVSNSKKLDRLDSLRGSTTDSQTEDTFGPLSNVRYIHVKILTYKFEMKPIFLFLDLLFSRWDHRHIQTSVLSVAMWITC